MRAPGQKILFFLPFALLLLEHAPLRFNLTPSMPRGLYRVVSTVSPHRGSLVQLCLPSSLACLGKARGYLGPGSCPCRTRPVLKEVIALPGDEIRLTEGEIRVNGVLHSAVVRRARDSAGRAFPRIPRGRYRVSPDSLWVLGRNDPRSWDSRYFGAVPTCHALVLEPLFTASNITP